MKKWYLVLISLVVFTLLASACGSNNNNGGSASNKASDNTTAATTENTSEETNTAAAEPESEAAPALEPVTLKWYYVQFGLPQDQETVAKAFNEMTQKLINTTVELVPIDFGDYENKMNTLVASNEEFDLVWTSSWAFKYNDNVNKGAFMEITDEMLDKYAPTIKSSFSQVAWNDTKVNGKTYAIPNFQTFTKTPGFVIQKRFVDKYGFDTTKVKTYADLEPLLEQIKKDEPDIVPFAMNKDQSMLNEAYGLQWLGGVHYYLNDPFKAVDILETPEYKTHVDLMKSWNEKGYINEDAASVSDLKPMLASGKVAVAQDFTLAPGSEAGKKNDFGGNEVVYAPIAEPTFTGVTPTMNAISHNSKHADRALMLLELLNTNSDLFNLLTFGVEGKHYTKVGDNTIKITDNSGYTNNTGWIFGNVTNGYLLEGQPADTWERVKKLNDTATVPALSGFNYNGENTKAEGANMDSVYKEYAPGLETGTIDPNKYVPLLVEKMKKAGLDTVMKDRQKQIDEWAAANGKQ
ncbi:ABC transporter substrate-binding protein [Paenibacillus sp. CF384]|uniref:ABC transporter substrate-binding protein n=1 Tax=Paenibacillus sp. CF384 TaxID=1884382 RepID=UPI00089BDB08|nr:ABC transporter substrate-binding protein [Paenibacillus sp. CF384]SDW57646.1 putative aldouronate transport system substrate-binding protein [Paenibacillus sp. CF384]